MHAFPFPTRNNFLRGSKKKEFLEGPNTNTDFLLVALLSAGRGRSRNFNANVGSSSIYLVSLVARQPEGTNACTHWGPKKAYSPPSPSSWRIMAAAKKYPPFRSSVLDFSKRQNGVDEGILPPFPPSLPLKALL